jgi:hypothetical protein
VIDDGRRTAQFLRLDKLARVKGLPLTLSVPWGLTPLPLPHFPLSAKIRMQVQVGLSEVASRTVVPMIRGSFFESGDDGELWDVYLDSGTVHLGGRVLINPALVRGSRRARR